MNLNRGPFIWQPMETAPKDGTWILLRVPELGISPIAVRWEDGGDGEPAGWSVEHRGSLLLSAPTGWAPKHE